MPSVYSPRPVDFLAWQVTFKVHLPNEKKGPGNYKSSLTSLKD